jgi:hypothetical protein
MTTLFPIRFIRWFTFAVLSFCSFVAAWWLAGWMANSFAVQQPRAEVSPPPPARLFDQRDHG